MARMSRWKDKLRGWKRLFLQNWALFKASKVGLIGLAIMLVFIILAFSAPFMGLRDPMWWRAPDTDIVSVKKYWPLTDNNSATFNYLPVTRAMATRIVPAALGVQTDRVYVAAGSRLYALDPTNGAPAWPSEGFIDFANPTYGDTRPTISVDPLIVNFGETGKTNGGIFWLYAATASGNVYGLNDSSVEVPQFLPPVVKIGTMDGPATGLVAFSGNEYASWTPYDMIAASSSKGSIYFWQVNETGHHLADVFRLGTKPIHMAGQPMRGNQPYPLFSPSFYYTASNRTRPYLYVGSEDGNLTALDIRDLSNVKVAWQSPLDEQPWFTAPVVKEVVDAPIHGVAVFAAGSNGTISALYALSSTTSGEYFPGWDGSKPIRLTALAVDGGNLTQPFLDPSSTNLLVGSSTGRVFSINYLTPQSNLYPNWVFSDTTFPITYISSAPQTTGGTVAFFAGDHDLGARGPSPDDIGTVFALDIDQGKLMWSVTFNTPIFSPISAMTVASTGARQLFFGTYTGAVYSFDFSGQYNLPAPPSWIHPYPSGNLYIFGLDNRGRDVFSQWVWGSRIALYVGFLAAFFSISIGTMMGLVAGYFGGRIEAVLMRFTDVILVIPGLPLIIALASVLGSSINNLILVIALVGWPGTARVVRSQVISLKERPFIESAKVTGASHARIMGRHILPNVLPLAFLYMTFAVSGAILSEASLSFIGLGDINAISWGRMLQDVTQSRALEAWWWLLPPGLAITLISLGFFLVGRAFDEIVNPRLRKR